MTRPNRFPRHCTPVAREAALTAVFAVSTLYCLVLLVTGANKHEQITAYFFSVANLLCFFSHGSQLRRERHKAQHAIHPPTPGKPRP